MQVLINDPHILLELLSIKFYKISIDLNGINMEILKQVIPNIVKPLTYICNRSFQEGCLHDGMIIDKVVPVFNAGDRSETIIDQFQYCHNFQRY